MKKQPDRAASLPALPDADTAIDQLHIGRLQAITEKALDRRRRGGAGAVNSQRAFAADVQHVTEWLHLNNLNACLPLTSATLFLYLSELADQAKWATINRRLASIVKWHLTGGYKNPAANQPIKDLLTGIRADIGTRQKQAPAFEIDPFKRLVAGMGDTIAGLRDKSLLLLGFAGAFRRSELIALDMEQLVFTTGGLLITYYKSKTNQRGDAEHKAFYYSPDPDTCPVRTLQRYLAELGRDSGPLFVRIRRAGNHASHQLTTDRLSDQHVYRLMKVCFGESFTAHSLRASFVTIAKLNGADDSEIMQQTGHKTTTMIRRYTRINDVMKHNAGKKLGL